MPSDDAQFGDGADHPRTVTDGGVETEAGAILRQARSQASDDANRDVSTPEGRRELERYVERYVVDETIVNARSIRSALGTDVSANDIGHALQAAADGFRGTWPEHVDVERWRETTDPVKWIITRTGGESTYTRRRRPWRKIDLIRETDAQLDIEDAITLGTAPDGHEYATIHRDWMLAALDAVCDALEADVEYEPEELSKAGITAILARVLDIEVTSTPRAWDKSVHEAIYDVLVLGETNVEEVGR